jgi:hypothetical protein
MADTVGKQPIRTVDNTDVKIVLADSAGTNLAAVTAGNALKTDASATTQPISVASLPLPSGAATSVKQPALGTAGSPSSDVITVQGATSMTAIKVDGSAVTQPVSGTFYQATQPISAAALPLPSGAATETTLAAIATALGASAGASLAIYNVDSLAGGASSPSAWTTTIANAAGSSIVSIVCGSTTSARYVVEVDPTGTNAWVTKWVAFTSEASPSFEIDTRNFAIVNGGKIRMTQTNTSNLVTALDVHHTFNIQYK